MSEYLPDNDPNKVFLSMSYEEDHGATFYLNKGQGASAEYIGEAYLTAMQADFFMNILMHNAPWRKGYKIITQIVRDDDKEEGGDERRDGIPAAS